MSRFNTGNPFGSGSPLDLDDNAKNMDLAVNSEEAQWIDRFERNRKTFNGMESEFQSAQEDRSDRFNDFIASSGYQFAGDYAAGIEITQYNQLVRDSNGEFWRVSGQVDLPYVTTGAGMPEGGNFVAVGDAVLRQDISIDAGELVRVTTATGAQSLAESIDKRISPCYKNNGGQIRSLKSALENPLHQFVGICMVGDSITWGRTLEDGASYEPRDATLSDARDNFSSPSFVNIIKRFIGENYFYDCLPVTSNWFASPSGESTVEYSKTEILMVDEPMFTLTPVSTTSIDRSGPSSDIVLGYRTTLGATNDGEWTISFPFTGREFSFFYTSNGEESTDYEVFVNGVSQGVFSTWEGSSQYSVERVHSFNYVKDATIEIKTVTTSYERTQYLYADGIGITKVCRITNQGIIGQTSRLYLSYNLSGNFNDGEAVLPDDQFIFVQLGTNDRGQNNVVVKGISGFIEHYNALLDNLAGRGDLILMAANKTDDEGPGKTFNMQQCRNAIEQAAVERNMDFIDNYTPFLNADLDVYLSDGLHPSERGHGLIAANIINSIAQS